MKDLALYRQRWKDMWIDRPSNAKYRCDTCRCETKAHVKRCQICTRNQRRVA